jgi:Dolichyl-phosphate-mannose-protein mannosyltransferase
VTAPDDTPSGSEGSLADGHSPGRFITYALRAAGMVLVALVLLPVYRLLDGPDAGRFPRGSLAAAELSRSMLFLGSFIAIAVAILASRVLDPSAIDRALGRLGKRLVAIPTLWFAGGLALIAAALTLAFSLAVLDGKPNLIDAMVQLVHARFIAAGHLAGPADDIPEFWQLQNSIVTPHGWVSQFPPGFVIFLAAGLRLGMVQLVGPVFAGLTVFFTALAAERLLSHDRATARVGAVMLCFSPFLIGLAAAFMNHIAAAAFTAAAIYCAVRSRDDGKLWWALLAGGAVGGVFSIRPLTGIVAAAIVAVVWLAYDMLDSGRRIVGFLRRSLAATVGISPVLAAVGAYNQFFFGRPFTFGYLASTGPLVEPGFHRDPTGAFYGPVQALAYTSSDLVTLSLYLLETPIPAVLVAGLFLVLSRRFSVGERVIAIWALLPVAANALYWHHGMFMGPRMLNEAAPPWALLTAIAAIGLVRLIPTERKWRNYSPRAVLTLAFALSWVAGLLYLGPQRLASYGGTWMESSRIEIPRRDRPSLVFVHGAWTGRIAMRLLSHGMRIDSLKAALRQNTTCDAHTYALWYSRPAADRAREAPPLDFSFVPRDTPPPMRLAAGDEIRVRPGVPLPRECLREVASDTFGIVDVGPLLWQGDLPGIAGDGPMFVRDMGPEPNARLIQRYPDRVPTVLLRPRDGEPPKVVPYAEGMNLLWPIR